MKSVFQNRVEQVRRKYYEIFGDLAAEVEFLKAVTLILLGFIFLSLFGAFVLAKRPPVVIRVAEIGSAEAIKDFDSNNQITDPEIFYFAKTFMRHYTEYNAYTISRDISDAFNLMTADFQKNANRSLVESGVLARVKESGIGAQIEFKEQKIEKNTPEYVVVSLIGVRTLTSYKNPTYRDASLVKSELVIKKRPRSAQVPAGLLVEDYREIILNKIEEKK